MSQLDLFGNPLEPRPRPAPKPEPLISPFDVIMQKRGNGAEFWSARDMQPYLGYTEWRNFQDAVDRAIASCRAFGYDPKNHFGSATKMVDVGSGARRGVVDFHLSRYACYLVAMNGDPRKPEIAAAQRYFAEQTRRAELAGLGQERRARKYSAIGKSPEWVTARLEGIDERKEYTEVLHEHGVNEGVEYAQCTDALYTGLFQRSAKGLKMVKALPKTVSLRDNMTPGELSAVRLGEYAARDKIEDDNLQGVRRCVGISKYAGQKVREALVDIKSAHIP